MEKTYRHGGYHFFKINDPKPRDIHKATVRDRLVHHAICRILYPIFDQKFIYDSYSCRIGKGTHRAMGRFRDFARKTSRNNARTAWVLKCDIKKFFASIDHAILKATLARHIKDSDVLLLLGEVIDSFCPTTPALMHESGRASSMGLPLGNLTSQLLANVYMNEFDQFMKRELKVRHYVRYSDDFVVVHENKDYIADLIPKIVEFLQTRLTLSLHPDKVSIKTFASGIDFLGWVHFPYHRTLRTSTKRRMFRTLAERRDDATVASYLGLLTHGNAHKIARHIVARYAK